MTDATVLIPTYNSTRFITETVRAALDQRGVNVQVVCSDDGSTDGTPDMLRAIGDPRIVVLRNKGRFIAASLNTALEHARGEFVCRCDHDDILPPGRLARQVAFLRAHPEFGAVCGQLESMDERGEVLAEMGCGDTPEDITAELRRGHIRTHNGTWLMRTDLLRRLGGVRHLGTTGEDHDLQLRFAEAHRVAFEPHVDYRYRLHDRSVTHNQPSAERLFHERLPRILQEQRRARARTGPGGEILEWGLDDLSLGKPMDVPADLPFVPLPKASEQVMGILIGAAWRAHRQGRRAEALRTGWRALRRNPASVTAWKNLLALAVKRPRTGP
ncbi:MAG: glycosyltransferase family 2 protein [Phycisphaerae bacterium]|nr:glycosyltransferase family 2 protein [Phycisphaerae bacterium]